MFTVTYFDPNEFEQLQKLREEQDPSPMQEYAYIPLEAPQYDQRPVEEEEKPNTVIEIDIA